MTETTHMHDVIDEHGNPILTEFVLYEHGAIYRRKVDSIEAALSEIGFGVDNGLFASVGVYVNGEPRIWNGYAKKDPPTAEQAAHMRDEYAKARPADLDEKP